MTKKFLIKSTIFEPVTINQEGKYVTQDSTVVVKFVLDFCYFIQFESKKIQDKETSAEIYFFCHFQVGEFQFSSFMFYFSVKKNNI